MGFGRSGNPDRECSFTRHTFAEWMFQNSCIMPLMDMILTGSKIALESSGELRLQSQKIC